MLVEDENVYHMQHQLYLIGKTWHDDISIPEWFNESVFLILISMHNATHVIESHDHKVM